MLNDIKRIIIYATTATVVFEITDCAIDGIKDWWKKKKKKEKAKTSEAAE